MYALGIPPQVCNGVAYDKKTIIMIKLMSLV